MKSSSNPGVVVDESKFVLPVCAALGGMIVPAALYLAITAGTDVGHGWGIPMATDIAFALCVLAFVSRRLPPALKLLLLTLALFTDPKAELVREFVGCAW